MVCKSLYVFNDCTVSGNYRLSFKRGNLFLSHKGRCVKANEHYLASCVVIASDTWQTRKIDDIISPGKAKIATSYLQILE